MKIGDEPPGVGFDRDQPGPDPIEHGQSESDAGQTVQQIAHRHPLRCRIGAGCPFEQRVESGAQVGPED